MSRYMVDVTLAVEVEADSPDEIDGAVLRLIEAAFPSDVRVQDIDDTYSVVEP